MLYKLTIRSVIDYGLVIFGTTLNQVDLNRLERVQYRAAKLVTGALHLTSREKLNEELGWETIRTRVDFLGLSLFHKIHNGGCRPLITTCLAERNMSRPTSTRNYKIYKNYSNFGAKFYKSFFPYFTKMFSALAPTIGILELGEFKKELKVSLKPSKYKHYSYGSKLGNKLITRLRVGRPFLHSHSYAVGKAMSPECSCHARQETTRHYLLQCFLYTVERQNLLDLVSHHVPNFKQLPLYKQENILLFGQPGKEEDVKDINISLTKIVQNFILQTKRFKY